MTIKTNFARIKTSFYSFTDAAFAAYAQSINTALPGNVNFPNTQPLLPNLADAVDAYINALANAASRDKVAVGLKITARKNLEVELLTIANSLQNEAQGDRDKLLSTRFDLYKNNYSPTPPLGPVTEFTVTDGLNPGTAKLKTKGPAGAKSFVHQYTPDPLTSSSSWNSFTSTFKEYTFTNLESAKKYWFRVIAVGVRDQVSVSDPVSRVVQ
ncbi:MAG TPA: hypothetical protein VFT78_07965 [Hanamia sp.]|jgi:hypothetical protein|nr:hypothetical protein [Hanamia sp.]